MERLTERLLTVERLTVAKLTEVMPVETSTTFLHPEILLFLAGAVGTVDLAPYTVPDLMAVISFPLADLTSWHSLQLSAHFLHVQCLCAFFTLATEVILVTCLILSREQSELVLTENCVGLTAYLLSVCCKLLEQSLTGPIFLVETFKVLFMEFSNREAWSVMTEVKEEADSPLFLAGQTKQPKQPPFDWMTLLSDDFPCMVDTGAADLTEVNLFDIFPRLICVKSRLSPLVC